MTTENNNTESAVIKEMTPAEARVLLETCNEQIETGISADLARQILNANAIVAADMQAKREAELADEAPDDIAPASPLRFCPRVQRMPDGKFQPVALYDDGGIGGVICGDCRATLQEAYDVARDAIEAALPAGVWDDAGEWFA